MFLGELLKPIGGNFLLHYNFEVSKRNISLPAFYRQCLVAWSELKAREPSSVHEIVNQVIWNNTFLCVDKKSVYRRDIETGTGTYFLLIMYNLPMNKVFSL